MNGLTLRPPFAHTMLTDDLGRSLTQASGAAAGPARLPDGRAGTCQPPASGIAYATGGHTASRARRPHRLVAGACRGWLDCAAEAWPSGRRHTPGKRVGGQLPRGFEPLSLRHTNGSSTCGFFQAVVRWSVLGPSQPGHGHVADLIRGNDGRLEAVPDEIGPTERPPLGAVNTSASRF